MEPSIHPEPTPKTLWRSTPLVNEMWLHDVYEMPREAVEETVLFGPLACPEGRQPELGVGTIEPKPPALLRRRPRSSSATYQR